MASLKMNIPHELSQAEALARIRGMLSQLKEEQRDKISNVEEQWKDETGKFQFSAMGFDLSGVINVTPHSVDIDARIPFAVSLFQGRIKEIINNKATELLSSKTS